MEVNFQMKFPSLYALPLNFPNNVLQAIDNTLIHHEHIAQHFLYYISKGKCKNATLIFQE